MSNESAPTGPLDGTDPAAAVSDLGQLERTGDRLLESLGEAVCVLDEAWRFVYWNAAAERMSGMQRSEVLGSTLGDFSVEAISTPLGDICRETMRTGEPRELRGWRFAGGPAGRAAGIYDVRTYGVEGGGLLVLFNEVSERVRQEQQLAARSAERESLRELARAMAAVADSTTLLGVLCDAAMRHGRADGALVGQQHGDEGQYLVAAGSAAVAAGERFPLAGSLFEQAIERRAVVSVPEYTTSNPRLRELAERANVGPLIMTPLIAQDQVLGVLCVMRNRGNQPFDSRDRERLAAVADHAALALWKARLIEEAQAADRAKGNFLATISHELRTPLTALTGYSELLVDEITGPLSQQQVDIVERMRSVTHHLTVMIDEILAYSALEAGSQHPVQATETTAAAIVHEVVAVIEPIAQRKGIALGLELPDHELPLVTDVDKARQILVNLAGNAVKFTDRDGSVRLAAEHVDGTVRFAVRDTGAGITPDDQHRIFKPFAQVETGLTRRHGGTGLGLYISRRLADLIGGRIELQSAVGEGSTFSLVLPETLEGGDSE